MWVLGRRACDEAGKEIKPVFVKSMGLVRIALLVAKREEDE